jgi:hypothetical protein
MREKTKDGIGLDDPYGSLDRGKGGDHQLAGAQSIESPNGEGTRGRVQAPSKDLPCHVERKGRCCDGSWTCHVFGGGVGEAELPEGGERPWER